MVSYFSITYWICRGIDPWKCSTRANHLAALLNNCQKALKSLSRKLGDATIVIYVSLTLSWLLAQLQRVVITYRQRICKPPFLDSWGTFQAPFCHWFVTFLAEICPRFWQLNANLNVVHVVSKPFVSFNLERISGD